MPLHTLHLSHEGQPFLRNRRQKEKDSAVTVLAPYRPTGARLRPGPVLTIPRGFRVSRYALTPKLRCALLALAGPPSPGPASAGARADDPVRLPSLSLCSDSEVALLLAGSCWASFSTVKHGQVPLPTRS
jgi:hypothetical protein